MISPKEIRLPLKVEKKSQSGSKLTSLAIRTNNIWITKIPYIEIRNNNFHFNH